MADGGQIGTFGLIVDAAEVGGFIGTFGTIVEADVQSGDVAAFGVNLDAHTEGGRVASSGTLLDAHTEGGQIAAAGAVLDAHNEGGRVAASGVVLDALPAPLGIVSTSGVIVEGGEHLAKLAAFGAVVEAICDFCFEGVVSTVGVLVEGYERDVFDVRAVNAKVDDLFERIRAEEARVRDLFDAGEVPDNETRGFIAALTGFRAEIKACRDDLDRRDVLDALVWFNGADAIRLWKWERQLRSALVTVDRQLRVAQEVARELLDNRPGRTYVTRAGETLQSIAVRFFGDPEEWRRITEANPGLDVGELEPGTVLNIPEGD